MEEIKPIEEKLEPEEKTATLRTDSLGENHDLNISKPKRNRFGSLLITAGTVLLILLIAGIIFYKPLLLITVNPTDSKIALDNQDILAKAKIKPGMHEVKITKPGYVPFVYKNRMKPFRQLRLEVELRKLPSPKVLVSENAFSVGFSDEGKNLYYLGNSGKTIYKLEVRQSKANVSQRELVTTAITPDTLPLVDRIVFSPDFSVALLKKHDGETGLYDFKQYDLLHQEFTSWGKDIGDVAWNTKGDKVVYYYAPDTGERSLVISDRSHQTVKRSRKLTDAGIDIITGQDGSPKLQWSQDEKTIIVVAQGKLMILNVATEDITVLEEQGVTSAQMSPDNKHLLYTKNRELYWLTVDQIDALSGKTEDQVNVGKYRTNEPKLLNIKADSSQAIILGDSSKIIVPGEDKQLKRIDLPDFSINNLYASTDIADVKGMGLSEDQTILYILSGNRLIAVTIDDGEYKL